MQFPDGRTNRWENYDAFGQPGKAFDEPNFVYERGPMKLLLGMTTYRDRESDGSTEPQTTSFWTDGMGRPWRTNYPRVGTDEQSFVETILEFGQLKSWRSRKGVVKTITRYDARGREEKHVWTRPDGTVDVTPEVERKWDDSGYLMWIKNRFATIDYSYDQAGQVREEGTTTAGAGGRAVVSYNQQEGKGSVLRIDTAAAEEVRKFVGAATASDRIRGSDLSRDEPRRPPRRHRARRCGSRAVGADPR